MAAKVHRCQRCSRRLRRRSFLDSMALLHDGEVESVVCPGCTTATEFVEMTVNSSLNEIAIHPDGAILTRPIFRRPQQEELRSITGDACA